MQILIAEDEQDIASIYKLALQKKGHEVIISSNGEECLQQYNTALQAVSSLENAGDDNVVKNRPIQSTPFDAVVLDYRMPKKDGMEVAKEILALNPDQRIIFASAYVRNTLVDSIKQLNQVVELMQKPFSMNTLVDTIEDRRIYDGLAKLNVDVKKIREMNPTHNQISDLLDGLRKLLQKQA